MQVIDVIIDRMVAHKNIGTKIIGVDSRLETMDGTQDGVVVKYGTTREAKSININVGGEPVHGKDDEIKNMNNETRVEVKCDITPGQKGIRINGLATNNDIIENMCVCLAMTLDTTAFFN